MGKALDRINAYSEIDFNFYGSRERRFMLVRGGMRPKGEVGWGRELQRKQRVGRAWHTVARQDVINACKFYDRDEYIDHVWNFDYACELEPFQLTYGRGGGEPEGLAVGRA